MFELKNLLQNLKPFDIKIITSKYKREKISEDLNKIVKTSSEFNVLKENEDYKENFLTLVSYIYTLEQIKKGGVNKKVSLKVSLFDDDFVDKISTLYDENDQPQHIYN